MKRGLGSCKQTGQEIKEPSFRHPTHSRSCKLASGTRAKPHLNRQHRPPERARTPRASRVTVRAPILAPSRHRPTVGGSRELFSSRDSRSAPPTPPQVLIKMRVALLAIALMGLVLGANAGAVDLTSSNFDAEVFESGKAAFVKFLAPWCVPHRRTPAAPSRDLRRARSARAAGARRDDRSTRRARFPAPRRWNDRPVAPAARYRRGHRPARHGTPPIVDPPREPDRQTSPPRSFCEPRKTIDCESLDADRPLTLPLPLDTGEATASR